MGILEGTLSQEDAIQERGSKFFGIQGPWYTVGYKMAVIVENRFGRDALIDTMRDPRRLLALYNEAAKQQNAVGGEPLPLWSEELLDQVKADARR